MSMSEYLHQVQKLTKQQLRAEATRLATLENRTCAELIAHLAEISDRKAYLPDYTSMWSYCLNGLNLTDGSVGCRIQVANACRRFPQLLESLAASRISLSVAAKLVPHLDAGNADVHIQECEGKTCRQTDLYLVRFKPRAEVKPGIRQTPSKNDNSDSSEAGTLTNPGNALVVPQPRPSTRAVEPANPEVFNFRFPASGEFKRKLERLAEVMGIVDVPRNLARLLEEAIDHALEAKDPQKKLERRKKREAAKVLKEESSKVKPRAHEVSIDPSSRYVSSELREKVFERANYQCEFVGVDGKRCTERTGLQIDHIVPHGMLGAGVMGNLRCLCGPHNLWAAEQVYGREFIRAKIQSARARVGT